MIQYLVIFLFFVVAISLMLVGLHISQYRKRASGCCGGDHCATNDDGNTIGHSCYDEKVDFVEKYKNKTVAGS
jgi:hypothetical protein